MRHKCNGHYSISSHNLIFMTFQMDEHYFININGITIIIIIINTSIMCLAGAHLFLPNLNNLMSTGVYVSGRSTFVFT